MKRMMCLFFVSSLFVSGCVRSFIRQEPTGYKKTFFNRTVEYEIHNEARGYLSRIETLVCQTHNVEKPIPEKICLAYHRDTDYNRDHHISPEEAETFFQEFVLVFEDSLGGVKVKPKKKRLTKSI